MLLNIVPSFNPILSQANESPIRSFVNTAPIVATDTSASSSVNNTADDYPELVCYIYSNSWE